MERIGGDVRGALRRTGAPDVGLLAAVTRVWPAAVGPGIARSAWPLRIARDGTLHVATGSASWAHELGLLEPELSARLAEALGQDVEPPTALRFAVGPLPSPGHDPDAPPPATPSPSPAELEQAAAVSSAIDDPELRELVRRAAAASLATSRSGHHL